MSAGNRITRRSTWKAAIWPVSNIKEIFRGLPRLMRWPAVPLIEHGQAIQGDAERVHPFLYLRAGTVIQTFGCFVQFEQQFFEPAPHITDAVQRQTRDGFR